MAPSKYVFRDRCDLMRKRRPYRDGTFVEYGHSLYEPTFVPLVETRYVHGADGIRYWSPRSRASGKEKRTDGQKSHQNRGQTKAACGTKQVKSAEKVNERDAKREKKCESNPEEVNSAECQQKATTDLESSTPESSTQESTTPANPSKSVEKLEAEQISEQTLPKLDQSIQEPDSTEKSKSTDIESTQNDNTKKEAGSGHESKTCSSTLKEAISSNTSCDISRCPSIEEVEDEEFKDWKTRKGNRL